MLRILIDTSVWLDLAKRRDGQRWIVALRLLSFQGRLELLVPEQVRSEFERNRPRAEDAVTQKVVERFRQIRQDLHDYAADDAHGWLEEMTHRVPLVTAKAVQNFGEIADILNNGRRLEPTDVEYARAGRRGIERLAPFHLGKNSVADALLVEQYRSAVAGSTGGQDDQYWFVTANYQDFSFPKGDRREPHPDLADVFDNIRSRYIYDIEGFDAALVGHFGDDFIEIADEVAAVLQEPRTLAEILEAEQEYFDKVWYFRTLIRQYQTKGAGTEGLSPELLEQINAAKQRIEQTYGVGSLGPWTDWEWGFVNGKLSALRWVLGDDWDFLDT